MNILLIGSGGREHALARAIKASPLTQSLFVAPGNAGTAQCGTNVALDVSDHQAVIGFAKAHQIDFVVVGPEAPLVAGLVDDLAASGIKAFGPSREAAALEGSKAFTKAVCDAGEIPTARYARFTEAGAAKAYVEREGAPIVIKADGLAAGKGVVVAATVDEALAAVDFMFGGGLGEAGAEVVIEECLVGEEVSFFALCDGTTALPFGSAQDHKRVGEGDTGPNTGGMGAYSPASALTPALEAETMERIVRPALAEMARRGTPFKGVLFAGLMLTADGPKLIEFNVRFGDPACEVLMERLRSDLLPALIASSEGRLDAVSLEWSPEPALTVVMAAKGYPGAVTKGGAIRGLERAGARPGVTVHHAGTKLENGQVVANGGRVLAVTATGRNVTEAQARAYAAVDLIDWPGGFCRRDIGWREVARETADREDGA